MACCPRNCGRGFTHNRCNMSRGRERERVQPFLLSAWKSPATTAQTPEQAQPTIQNASSFPPDKYTKYISENKPAQQKTQTINNDNNAFRAFQNKQNGTEKKKLKLWHRTPFPQQLVAGCLRQFPQLASFGGIGLKSTE